MSRFGEPSVFVWWKDGNAEALQNALQEMSETWVPGAVRGQTYVTLNLCLFVMARLDYPLGCYTFPTFSRDFKKSTDAPGIRGC